MTASKIVAAAASGAAGDPVDVDDIFNTFLWDGNSSSRSITNNIDLSGEGGLVWIKKRSGSANHTFQDTARGATKHIRSNGDSSESTEAQTITAFNSNGFTIGTDDLVNATGSEYAGWTFRKAPKFFDVVTYTGTGSTRTLNHNLNSEIGQIWIKCRSSAYDWNVFSKGVGGYMSLRLTDGEAGSTGTTFFNNATTTQFTITGGGNTMNATGETYVAYLFAHNNGDGNFGPNSDQDIIKVGTYTGDGNATGALQNLGFEPQFVIIKNTNLNTERWHVFDSVRGIYTGNNDYYLVMNEAIAELNHETIQVDPNGFRPMTSDDKTNGDGRSYLYMAIRRGPLTVPEDATKVFSVKNYASNNDNIHQTGFDVDMNINTQGFNTSNSTPKYTLTRLLNGNYLQTHSSNNEGGGTTTWWNSASNVINLNTSWWSGTSDVISWSWKRAPSYFDVVAYSGTGSATTISHNLGVTPEMMWVKRRDASGFWSVYHKGINGGSSPEDYYLILNDTSSEVDDATIFNDTAPTSSVFSVGTHNRVNNSSGTYVAYLFATASGVSKVGSYAGNATSPRTIDCGFSNGARVVLLKKANGGDSWYLFDTLQGIVSGNDPFFMLDNNSAQTTNQDLIEPDNSGFIVNAWANGSGTEWIFYAIA